MATETTNYGTRTGFSAVTNLNSLGNNTAEPLGTVDNTGTKATGEKIELEITLNSSGVSSAGTIELYALESGDDTDWTDGIDGDATTDQAASLKNAKLLAVLNANANSQVVRASLDLLLQLGPNPIVDVPQYWSVLVYNKSGAAFSGSGNGASYTPIKRDVA